MQTTIMSLPLDLYYDLLYQLHARKPRLFQYPEDTKVPLNVDMYNFTEGPHTGKNVRANQWNENMQGS